MSYTVIQPAEAIRLAAVEGRYSLRDLERQKEATGRVLQTLEAEQARRQKPLEDRKDELRRSIKLLEALEGECDEAILAIENDMRPDIQAAEQSHYAADAAHWEVYRAERRVS